MRNLFHPALVGAAWLTATAAVAQTPPAPAEAAKQAASFVQSYAAPTARLHQIARWDDPICVQVTGLLPNQAAQVKARIEDVAKALGASLAPAGCAPGIEIVFSEQPQGVLDNVAARRPLMLGYDHRDAKTLKIVTRPIQAWYTTASVGGGGPNAGAVFSSADTPAARGGSAGGLRVQTRARVLDDPDNDPPTGCGDSHFSSCLSSVFDNVLVVVDNGRMRGKNLGLVSDYVTMLALSQPRSLDGCNVLPSITDLFAACPGRAAPDGLTPADAAYLTALYETDPEANKAGQQSDIADRMSRMLGATRVPVR